MKGERVTAMTTMKRVRRNNRRGIATAHGCDIMFTSNDTEVVVSEVNSVVYDKLLMSRVEVQVSSRRLEGVVNRLQVYHPSPRDDGVNKDVCIPKSVLRSRERGKIIPVDKKRGPKKLRA